MLDGTSGVFAAYGLRRLLSSYSGPLVRVLRSSDSAEQDFPASEDGWIDAAALATFVGAGDGHVVTWYDQSGSGRDGAPAFDWARPIIALSGALQRAPNGRPWLNFDGVRSLERTIPDGATGADFNTLCAVARFDGTEGDAPALSVNNIRYIGAADGVFTASAGGDVAVTYKDGGRLSSIFGVFGGNSLSLTINGANKRGPAGFGTTASKIYIGKDDWGRNWTGGIAEAFVIARALTNAEVATLTARHLSAWGTVAEAETATLTLGTTGDPISPYVIGSNEHGVMETATPTSGWDAGAGVTIRRLGGVMMSTYNWTGNFDNSGIEAGNINGRTMAGQLALTGAAAEAPHAVIDAFHANSRALGAKSIVQLPLVPYVAADAAGAVSTQEAAPSSRWVPVVWSSSTAASDPVNTSEADMPHLIRRLIATHGTAGSGGIHGYMLDNEPGLWETILPLTVGAHVTIADLIARSIAAATAIKSIDPSAEVFAPACWGVNDFIDLTSAPDWSDYSSTYDCFLAAFLAAFSDASIAAGIRLLDGLDVHFYPQSWGGGLWDSADSEKAELLLQAPRTLTEPGYAEDSWVAYTLDAAMDGGLARPLIPALRRLIAAHYPGTEIFVSEWEFGGPGALVTGLATADMLGRLAAGGISYATHWGDIRGWIAPAFQLFQHFGDTAVEVENTNPDALAAHAAMADEALTLLLVNKSRKGISVTLPGAATGLYGFDAVNPVVHALTPPAGNTLPMPGRSARLVVIA
ncbi:glycoside hydrolase family 44 protein [Xanthobacter agilis]|uniref:Glycoside hydrolase family 44 domain-containing protein n=1 Tax=Xanthobacter agilis TaxID=47492 RepID=A0ABU0LK23_XANAG|nr:glycoside hydrolase family 44 protein [Xanthobacter agilis]MDQ0507433.1 hypothetical protein [Xanthobacter agilis]